MKAKLAQPVLGALSARIGGQGLQIRGKLLFRVPVDQVLCGLCLDDSGFDAQVFHPTVFVQPLYSRASHLVFNFGRRFVGNWRSDDPTTLDRLAACMQTEGVTLWQTLGTPEALAHSPARRNPHDIAAMGYSAILIGDHMCAQSLLRVAQETLAAECPDQVVRLGSWPNGLHATIEEVLRLLRTAPDSATALLREWRNHTLHALGLVDFAK